MSDATFSSPSSDAPLQEESAENFLDLLYATLFHPVQTFRRIAAIAEPDNRLIFYALIAVVVISACGPVVYMANRGGNPADLVLMVPLSGVLGTLGWVLMSVVTALAAYVFTGGMRIRTFMVLSGLATLPWLLLAPVSLFKAGLGSLGLTVSVLLGLGIWLWSVLLFAIALLMTYKMTVDRLFIALLMPLAMLIVCIGWLAGFIGNVVQLAPAF